MGLVRLLLERDALEGGQPELEVLLGGGVEGEAARLGHDVDEIGGRRLLRDLYAILERHDLRVLVRVRVADLQPLHAVAAGLEEHAVLGRFLGRGECV